MFIILFFALFRNASERQQQIKEIPEIAMRVCKTPAGLIRPADIAAPG